MDIAYRRNLEAATARCPPADCISRGGQGVFADIVRTGRTWAQRLATDDPLRAGLMRMSKLVEDQVVANDYSTESLASLKALVCINCRSLAAHPAARNTGPSVDRCLLQDGSPR